MRVQLTVSLTGVIEQEMTQEEFDALDKQLDEGRTVKIGDKVDIDWAEAINSLDGEIEDVELVT